MDSKEDGEGHEDRPTSPYGVLHHLSKEAVGVAGEALHSVHLGNPNSQSGPGHRRSQSEVTPVVHRRTSSFQRLKSQVQKAWRWGANSRERDYNSNFNPESWLTKNASGISLTPKLRYFLNILLGRD